MRVPALRFWSLAAALLVLNAAGLAWIRHGLVNRRPAALRVLSVTPTNDADEAERLSILFDEPVVAPETVDAPLQRSPFQIDPPPDGHWVYGAPERLDFVLREPLPPGRLYRVEAGPDAEAQLGRALAGDTSFTVRTRPLLVADCRLASADHAHVTVEIEFNQPVAPRDLLSVLELTARGDDEPLSIEILDAEPGETLAVRAGRPGAAQIQVRIEPGLAGHGGQLSLEEPFRADLAIPRRFALLRASASAGSLGDRPSITLRFSASLDPDQPIPAVRVEPEVEDLQVSVRRHRLRLIGSFEIGRSYDVTVPAQLADHDGQALGTPQSVTTTIPDRRPTVSFDHRQGRLSPHGNLQLDLRVVNVSSLDVRAGRVHENNLVAHLRGTRSSATSRRVADREIRIDAPRNEVTDLVLDLEGLLPPSPGIHRISVRANDTNWVSDSAIVCISDMALTTKQGRGGLLVWVTSLRTAEPVAGATVSALTYTNQQLATAVTGADGTAMLLVPPRHPDGPVWAVIAQHGSDLTYIRPDKQGWAIDDVDRSGRKVPGAYDVMLYTERGVYRPGDPIHLTGIVRERDGAVPPSFPLEVAVERPDGRIVSRPVVHPDPALHGLFHLDVETAEDDQTGRYRFLARIPGDESTLGVAGAHVEAFVPVRMTVSAEPRTARVGPGDVASVQVRARYLFDRPAAGLAARLAGEYRPIAHESAAWPDFTFTASGEKPQSIEPVIGALDEDGSAILELPACETAGPARATLSATVTETGGRSVSAAASLVVDPHGRHLGLRLPAGRIVSAEAPGDVEWVIVDGADRPVTPRPVELCLERIEHDWSIQRVGERWTWRSVGRPLLVLRSTIEPQESSTEPAAMPLRCPDPGRYRLSARELPDGARGTLEFNAISGAAGVHGAVSARPERLEILFNDAPARPGETLEALVRALFPGRLLLSMETDRVVQHRVVDLAETAATLELPMPADLRGSAFVAGIVVRPVDPGTGSWQPQRALGLSRLLVDHEAQRLPVRLDAPARVEPGQTIEVRLATESPRDPDRPPMAHVWAVAEGILAAAAYDTPDPHGHFFAPRSDMVRSADVFAELLPDHLRPAGLTRIGGDRDRRAAMARRRSPVPTRRRKAQVLWRRAISLDASGEMTIPMTMPDGSGAMRIMAVVVDGDRYGSAEHRVTVTAPLLAEMSAPRAVAPGDCFQVPVKLFNATDAPLEAAIDLRLEGPLALSIAGPRTVAVPAGSSATQIIELEAVSVGPARVELTVVAESANGTMLAHSRVDLAVRPVAPLETTHRLIRMPAGETIQLDPCDGLIPDGAQASLTVSGQPQVQLLPALEQLLDYPYGCLEQSSSRLLALLHAPALLADAGRTEAAEVATEMIDAGVARIRSMQTPDGGLAYWPGGTTAHPWATAYAARILVEARDAGHRLDPDLVQGLRGYLEDRLERSNDDEANGDNRRSLLCRVLAELGKAPIGWMGVLSERLDRLDTAGRAHLASAWLSAGRRDRALSVLGDDAPGQQVIRTTSRRITSPVRQDAVLLSVLLELDPEHRWIVPLVERVDAARSRGGWSTTLDNATALAALARYQALCSDVPSCRGTIIGAGVDRVFDERAPVTVRLEPAGGPVTVQSSGQGWIYAVLTAEGFGTDSRAEIIDRGLLVRRRWLDHLDRPVDPGALRVGDLVRVEIELATTGPEIGNVAIVDLLPGGLEIEHPRLATSAGAGRTAVARADRAEFLDDRVVLFASAGAGPRVFKYALRATTAGSFRLPVIQASCMYEPAFSSVHGGGRVEIAP